MAHRLVLPLPPEFSSNNNNNNNAEFSIFSYDSIGNNIKENEGVSTSQPQLKAYIDRLEEFLRKTRLIQYHPENFFRFICSLHINKEGTETEMEPLEHLDGTNVKKEEVEYLQELCESFAKLVPHEDIFIHQLHNIIREGPPKGATTSLQEFFSQTKLLQMNRRRRELNDAASVTLHHILDKTKIQRDIKEEKRRTRILSSVLGYGMGEKKKHEVEVMRDTALDLVDCCNTSLLSKINKNSTSLQENSIEPVETIINIGEGKGYVSRALALCDGLQVIGLDCNPLHKERVAERVEFMMQGRLNVNSTQSEMCGGDILNLLYEPRGYMASVACRVGSNVDWFNILRGHVRICEENSNSNSLNNIIVPIKRSLLLQEENFEEREKEKEEKVIDDTKKIQCRICRHITRRGSVARIVRHTLQHLQNFKKFKDLQLPSKEIVDEWNRTLSVELFSEKIINSFFTDKVNFSPEETNAYTNASTKRHRSETDNITLGSENTGEKLSNILKNYNFLSNIQLSRGTRAMVLLPVKKEIINEEKEEENNNNNNKGKNTIPSVYFYSTKYLTIVGYDCAPNRHFVIMDDKKRKEAFTLLHHCNGINYLEGKSLEEIYTPPAEESWLLKLAILIHVIPPISPHTPIVYVPSLRNTIMMGLHPCGDLGSNICRLFTESSSRGLLLVSCCWHALTDEGFPLSYELQKRGWSTNKLSLLLATQPLDMWATASAEGHRGSARLLFFRSVLKILWKELQKRWQQRNITQKCCCNFVSDPHLEPSFLRRMSRVKDTVTLQELYLETCREYFFEATAKQTIYTWQNHICTSCRLIQADFLADATNIELATKIGEEYYTTHFRSFLGLTILRMWMSHLVETLLLLDRAFYLSETLRKDKRCEGSVVSLVPLFDGAVSPRMYGILARRIPHN